ncbi:MAG: HAD-IA family hydrolase [Candidatus Pacearchaeota archaeon]|nr:HAD-IA family hydrolase [Candidatus Pacearchaeota archaeon]
MIKAIIWDIGGVLGEYIGNCNFWKNVKEEARELRDKFGSSKMSAEEFIEKGSKLLNMNKEDFLKGYKDYTAIRLNEPAIKIYKKIKIDKYILSDVSPLFRADRAEFFKGVCELAKETFWSTDIKMRKSSIEAFKFVLKKINRKPEEVLFIDDVKELTDRAKSLGINTIHYQNPEQLKLELKDFGIKIK